MVPFLFDQLVSWTALASDVYQGCFFTKVAGEAGESLPKLVE
jgi:hypothetical protein